MPVTKWRFVMVYRDSLQKMFHVILVVTIAVSGWGGIYIQPTIRWTGKQNVNNTSSSNPKVRWEHPVVDIPAWKDEQGGHFLWCFLLDIWLAGRIFKGASWKKTNLSLLNSSCQTDFGNGLINSTPVATGTTKARHQRCLPQKKTCRSKKPGPNCHDRRGNNNPWMD